MKFKNPHPMTREELVQKFSSRNKDEICHALLSMAFYEEDWDWAQNQCLNFLEHSSVDVRGMAVTCIGHIARIHRMLDREFVETALSKHTGEEMISGIVQDTLNDIQIFIN